MVHCEREISKEIYDRADGYNGLIADEDKEKVFSVAELCGYGVYLPRAFERDGKYYVSYERGDSCD